MNPKDLHTMLKKSQEKKGFFFNPDYVKTMDLINGLITNKNRYGYMVCPCRLSANDKAADKDIICPCDYREDDVKEFGSCYCKLYVTDGMSIENLSEVNVPERRPLSKLPF